jgi:ethanolamine utilization protein EutA
VAERLLSVGLDVGTTSTQMILSQLQIENKAGSFTVPQMEIAERKILYQSPVHFTPLLGENLVDGEGVRRILEQEYLRAGVSREQVDTGAVIITGETSRKENARAVLDALSELAGDFVVATAGPELESKLAAKGAGAEAFSANTGKTVLHMDIGGGTSNLALIREGRIVAVGCMNVGGRLIKTENGRISYVSPVLQGLTQLRPGDPAQIEKLQDIARILVQALEMAAGLRQRTELLDELWTREAGAPWVAPAEDMVISFSGGVADCVEKVHDPFCFGDMGPILGQTIQESLLCRGAYRLGDQTIRATVIGAGCHSAQLSGSTVFYENVTFPLKNRPVVRLTEQEQALSAGELEACIRNRLATQDTDPVLSLPGSVSPGYGEVKEMGRAIVSGFGSRPVYVAVEQDMAKALGQVMALCAGPGKSLLCIDRVRLTEGDYLDVAAPVGPAMPVVVKTLILAR